MFTQDRSRTALFALLLGGALLLPTAALADHHEGDAMQQGDSMEHDGMSGEAMEGDAMKQDAMKSDAMGEEDAMAGDDAMKSEGDDEMMMDEDDEMMKDDGEM
ncbi:pentapeptide MXKDX repeat protein [Halomonas organivorans]|uniref:Pentapeptide MXKDX repeat protein n=1 Tax=Halomonas organivorans TaxID=257772 RepID=A0A7W5G5H3_9GAMM|nr:pentapeptide MXKDX repeat protein [Halomonas organivorans]MBB3140421.1 pentapeptide MXKDX repeat protein [Halomonas organivorans]